MARGEPHGRVARRRLPHTAQCSQPLPSVRVGGVEANGHVAGHGIGKVAQGPLERVEAAHADVGVRSQRLLQTLGNASGQLPDLLVRQPQVAARAGTVGGGGASLPKPSVLAHRFTRATVHGATGARTHSSCSVKPPSTVCTSLDVGMATSAAVATMASTPACDTPATTTEWQQASGITHARRTAQQARLGSSEAQAVGKDLEGLRDEPGRCARCRRVHHLVIGPTAGVGTGRVTSFAVVARRPGEGGGHARGSANKRTLPGTWRCVRPARLARSSA